MGCLVILKKSSSSLCHHACFFSKVFKFQVRVFFFSVCKKERKELRKMRSISKGFGLQLGQKNQHVKISCTKTNACCSDHLLIILQWIQKLLQLQIKLKRYSRQLLYTIITPINATSAFYSLLPKKLKIKTQTITQKMCIFYCVIRTQRLTCTFY